MWGGPGPWLLAEAGGGWVGVLGNSHQKVSNIGVWMMIQARSDFGHVGDLTRRARVGQVALIFWVALLY